jgi:hypothetical protein
MEAQAGASASGRTGSTRALDLFLCSKKLLHLAAFCTALALATHHYRLIVSFSVSDDVFLITPLDGFKDSFTEPQIAT